MDRRNYDQYGPQKLLERQRFYGVDFTDAPCRP